MTPVEIKRIRQLMRWSQERLARELGVSFCTVNRWENGRTAPSPMALKVLHRLREAALRDNRRGAARIDLRCPLDVTRLRSPGARAAKGPAADAFFRTYTRNISSSGAMLAAPYPIAKGEKLRLSFELNDSLCGRRINTVSDVRWGRDNGGDNLVGVRFNEVDPVDVSRIERLIRGH